MQSPEELRARFQRAMTTPKESTMRMTPWIVLVLVVMCVVVVHQKGGLAQFTSGIVSAKTSGLVTKQLDLNLDDDPFFQTF